MSGNVNLIDFCYTILGTEITCDTSSQFNPKNLTSSDWQLKKQGFLVDYFIKPPIYLKLTFEHPLWISHLKFETQVGQQKTKGFEIYVNGSIKCARQFLQDPNQSEVICQNFSFPGNSYDGDKNKFRLGSTSDLKQVKNLTIRIFNTFNSTLPCLANLQIWAELSEIVSVNKKKEISSIWLALNKAKLNPQPKQIPNSTTKSLKRSHPELSNELKSVQDIPEEFVDALTFKRMNIPMLLPCGQYVDRSSLDNYNDIESKWGRRPNDPFTGLAFTDERKPIFDSKLKARIDSFVLNVNSHENKNSAEPSSSSSKSSQNSKKYKITTPENSSKKTEEENNKGDDDGKNDFSYGGSNLDALLNQALQGTSRILGQKNSRAKFFCTICEDQSDNLYKAVCEQCKIEEKLLCKSCLIQFEDNNAHCDNIRENNLPLLRCHFCK